MINKKMKESKSINLDYSRLQDKLDYKGFEKSKKSNTKFNLKMILYTFLVCILSVIATLGIQEITVDGQYPRDFTPLGKVYGGIYVEEGVIDELIAYGQDINSQIILESDLLNNHNKEEFTRFQTENKIGMANYDIFFGIKEGKDIIIFSTMSKKIMTFICESSLMYSFSSIVKDFEIQYEMSFTQEYLQCHVGECGIYIDFIMKQDIHGYDEHYHGNDYKPYYVVKYQEQVYIINK